MHPDICAGLPGHGSAGVPLPRDPAWRGIPHEASGHTTEFPWQLYLCEPWYITSTDRGTGNRKAVILIKLSVSKSDVSL